MSDNNDLVAPLNEVMGETQKMILDSAEIGPEKVRYKSDSVPLLLRQEDVVSLGLHDDNDAPIASYIKPTDRTAQVRTFMVARSERREGRGGQERVGSFPLIR